MLNGFLCLKSLRSGQNLHLSKHQITSSGENHKAFWFNCFLWMVHAIRTWLTLRQETRRQKGRDNLGLRKLTSGVTLEESLSLRAQLFITWNNNSDFYKNPPSGSQSPPATGYFPSSLNIPSNGRRLYFFSCTERQTQILEISQWLNKIFFLHERRMWGARTQESSA